MIVHVILNNFSWDTMLLDTWCYNNITKSKTITSNKQVLKLVLTTHDWLWVNEAWEGIPEENGETLVQICSISNALDDTEDHLVYEEDDGQEGDDDLDEFETDSKVDDD